MWGPILFSKTYLLDVSAWEVIRALLPFRRWGRRELGCRTGRQQQSCCWEREPPCDQQALATGTRGERGWFVLSSVNVIASHGQTLMFKITPVVCDYAKVTLEMSTASRQGFKHNSPCLWWSPNILLFTESKNKVCFPRAENLACMKRQVFPNCFCCSRDPWFIQWPLLLP